MKGRLITIESGSDASGKATQTKKLYERLLTEGYRVKKVEYPNYTSESSALVKMYLSGKFGKNAEDVDAYIASTFFAADRYASYKTEWESFYKEGGIILADRYTTSNMVHQACKLNNVLEREKFLNWLWQYEFEMYKLPIPNCVIFLDVPIDYSVELMKNRENKFTGEKQKDIHESNIDYLIQSYKNALEVASKYGWQKIRCTRDSKLREIEDIHEEIYSKVIEVLK
ncbi:thymidylate kinase [Sporanaerobium hydrogeniformans]|uniref:Thymidylate kinase n=1 Tax=Sporanaerobium hydrogeniformans TaxID=3072179 RepID=A0AC61D9H1_9FIRM|nr:deoxynucleoside kinase [Sporanaerobium hydrogeniformans]PHV69383.1 thymidylate kinase [Sporanaerobium hydrogeniformans]